MYEPNTGCWLWYGALSAAGYGQIRMRDYAHLVHRVRYKLKFGEIPNGICVLHKCDNPLCSNPDHMFLGTKKDNNNDRHKKGRSFRGTLTKLDSIQILTIRSLVGSGYPYWQIGKYFGVRHECIRKIIRLKTYKNI